MAQETEVVVFEVDVSSYEKSLADLTKSINGLKDAQADLQKQTKNGAKGAAESLEKVKAQLKLQQQEYRTTQNVLVGYIGAKQKEVNVTDFSKNSIQANRDLLKQLTAQYITTVKPTQDFTDKIKNLSDELKKQEGAIGDTRRNVGNYFNEFAKGIPVVGQMIDPVKNISKAFSESGFSAQGFQAALLGGIPLIIAGFEGLVSIMKKFDSVTEGLEDKMNGLNFAFDYFVGHANDSSILDLADNLGKAYDEGVKLSQQMRELGEQEDLQRVFTARANKEIDSYIIKSKDKTKSEKDRLEFLDLASKKEKENLDKQIALATQRVDAAMYELKRVMEAGLNDDAAKKALNNANVALATFENESGNLQDKIVNRRNALLDEISAKRDKDAAAAKAAKEKADADAEKSAQAEIARLNKVADENERLEQLRIESLETGLQKEEDLYLLSFEKKFTDLKNAGLTEQQIEEYKQQGLNDIRAKYAVKAVEIEEGKFVKMAEAQDKANQETNDKALAAQKKTGDEITQAVTQTVNAISGILSAVSNLINQTASDNVEALKEQAGDSVAEQKKFMAETREIKLKAWKESKAISLTMAVMNTANAVMAQISNPTPYVGFVLAALAAATGAIQIATIAKQKPPKFAKGGKVIPIDGASHSDGGTPIHVNGKHVAEAEKGEGLFIMKRDAYQDINMLSGWNQRYGGNSWGKKVSFAADGGLINIPTSDGGFATREIKNTVDNALLMKQAIRDGFSSAPTPEVSIVELNRKQTSRNRSVNVVNL